MVLKGQFLERPTLVQQRSLVLEGLSHRGDLQPPLLALPPAPDEGSMDHVVCAEVVWAAAMAGFPTLRFNFRGVGASQGAQGDFVSQLEDAEYARRLLVENAGTDAVVAAALGRAGAVALSLAALAPLKGLALVSPVGINLSELAAVRIPLVVVVAEEDWRVDRAELAKAVSKASGQLGVVEKADAAFTRNLPQVGKAVVHLLDRLAGPREA